MRNLLIASLHAQGVYAPLSQTVDTMRDEQTANLFVIGTSGDMQGGLTLRLPSIEVSV